MVINSNRIIAYKCPACEDFVVSEFSLFDLAVEKKIDCSCKCENTYATIRQNAKFATFDIPCFACEENHRQRISMHEFWLNPIIIVNCSESTFPIAAIGDENSVGKWVNNYDESMHDMMDEMGYENYFSNDEVMLDIIDVLHDFSKNKKLRCECGSVDVEMMLLYDKIILHCPHCRAEKTINANDEMDLTYINKKKELTLKTNSKPVEAKIISFNTLKKHK